MTRARTASFGLVTPPPLYRWIDAVLMLFAELVSYAVSTLQMVLVRRTRECHTTASPEDLPRATGGLHQETHISQPSFSGKRAARIPRIPVATTQGTTTHSHATQNQDARDKPKHDSVIVLQTGSGPSAASPAKAGIQSARNARSGNRQTLSPLIPTDVGIQGTTRSLSRLAASIRARSTPVRGFRRFILSQSKDVGVSCSCCAKIRLT